MFDTTKGVDDTAHHRLKDSFIQPANHLTIQLQADVIQAHSSEQHSISLSTEHDSAHSAHQAWVLPNSGAVLCHMVLPLQEVLQPLHSVASRLPRLLSFPQQQKLGQYSYLPANPGLGQGTGVAGAA